MRRANDNGETFALLDACGVRGPEWRRVQGGAALAEAARELGYPARDVCMKPVVSSGSRGFRILSAGVDRRHQLLHERPGSLAMRLEDVVEILGDDETELLVMELVQGDERTIDGFARDGELVVGAPEDARGRCAPGWRCSSRRWTTASSWTSRRAWSASCASTTSSTCSSSAIA